MNTVIHGNGTGAFGEYRIAEDKQDYGLRCGDITAYEGENGIPAVSVNSDDYVGELVARAGNDTVEYRKNTRT